MDKFIEKLPVFGIGISLLSAVFTLFMYIAAEKANEEAAKANELTRLMVEETVKANELTKLIANETAKTNELTKSMVNESAKANVLSEKTMAVISEQKEIAHFIYEKDQANKAVWTSSSLETFKKTFDISIKVEIKLQNMSKYTQSIYVKILSENICVYANVNSIKCNKQLELEAYAIAPNDYYENSFYIHSQEGSPELAKVIVLVYDANEDKLLSKREFKYKNDGNKYSYYE